MFYCSNDLNSLPVEEWKEIKEFGGRYLVSNYGRIKSLIGKPKILKQYKTTGNYLIVKLSKNHKAYNRRVHRLVALAFLDVDDKTKEVHHINKNQCDNRVSNLIWLTKEEHYKIHQLISKTGTL